MIDVSDRDALRRAAERIDVVVKRLAQLAEDATSGPWRAYVDEGLISVQQGGTDDPDPVCTDAFNNGLWIATWSPIVTPPILAWLRDAADCIREHIGDTDEEFYIFDGGKLCANELQAIEFVDLLFKGGTLEEKL